VGELAAAVARARTAAAGVRVVLAGPPNAGKSTLFNHLIGRDRAIVSARGGTTRDVLEAEVELGGVRVVLVDTAGLGGSRDEVDVESMRRARAALDEAAVAVVLEAVGAPESGEAGAEPPPGAEVIEVASKADLGAGGAGRLRVSVDSGEGLAELERSIVAAVVDRVGEPDAAVVANARHGASLERALAELDGADAGRVELTAEAVRWALRAIDELVGSVSSEELLDEVFSTFCLGK
jgi:tRNA modification GTPase